ncbi:sugar-binding domain-containing protein [Natronospora cellulosivora (SeqCode)]
MKHLGNQPGVFCLNHGWKFINEDISVLPPTKEHIDVYSFAKGGAAKGPAAASFDDSNWEEVSLPHDWVTEKPFTEEGSPNQGYKERGIGWYRIKFNLDDEDRDKQILLEFEGMSCDAEIYCNGMLLKRNFSGYKSFSVDMTDMAHFGITPNIIAIRIDASAWEGWWYEGAGIYRNVCLVKKAPIHIAYNGSYIKPIKQDDGNWQLEIETKVENSFEFKQEFSIMTEIYDKEGNVVAKGSEEGLVAGYSDRKLLQTFHI